MAKYKATAPQALLAKIKSNYDASNRAAAQALNRGATFAVQRAVTEISKTVNLKPAYIKKHFKVSSRASPDNLTTSIYANERATLLSRYPNAKTKDGVRVSVNKGSGFRELKGAFKISGLRGSGADGIAMRNKIAAEFFQNAATKGLRTQPKALKLAKLLRKATEKPNGIFVFHSRSINQMFLSVREDVQPLVDAFVIENFIQQYNRLKK